MRYLNPNQQAQDDLLTNNEAKEINQELIELGNRIDAANARITLDEQALQNYKNEPSITKQQGNFDSLYVAGDGTIPELTSTNITAENIDSTNINAEELVATTVEADYADIGEAIIDKATAGEINASIAKLDSIDANNIATSTIAASSGAFENLSIDNANIETFNITNANVDEKLTADEIEATDIKATNVECDKTITNLIEADAALLTKMQSHNIIYDDTLQMPFYIPIEPGTYPTGDEYRVLEVPFFDTGDYYLCLKDPNTGICWWSIIAHNNHNNITVSYSRRDTDADGNQLSVPTLDSFYIWDYLSESPKLYIKTFVGGNLYWRNSSLNEENPPQSFDNWPFDISRAGALEYKCLHTGATWFSKHIDIIRNQSLENASLFLIPTDWNNADRAQVEYNGMIDIPWHYYVPNQSVNDNDEVTFRNLIINPLDGKWVYNIENALQGKDPVTIGADGQLNPVDNIIETEELAKWNGKVGIGVPVQTQINGTIFRDQAYQQSSNPNIFTKVDLATYDFCNYGTTSTRTDIVSVRRKSDQAIILSSTRTHSTYEDGEGITWDLYIYTYYDIAPDGSIFEEWIERQLPDSTYTHRLLQSTVNSNDFINYTRFEEPFEYGVVNLNKYAYGSYSNTLTHLGNVEEGRWNAGDVHVTKRDTPQTGSSEPAYNGNLTVDNETSLNGAVTIRDRNDLSDIKNVPSVNVYTDNDVKRATNADVIYGEDWNSQEDHTGKATIKYSEMELIGHKEDALGDEVKNVSNILIRDDVTIGKNEVGDVDKHNLIVNGKIYAENITVPDGNDGDNMRFRNVGTVADPEIVSQAEPCAEVENGVLITTDNLITGEKVGEYNGTTNPHKTTDADYDPTEDAYPIVHLGDNTTVHGDVHVEETAQIDGNTTIGKPASGADPAVPADLRVIGNEHIEGTSQLDGDVTIGVPASGADPAVPADLHVTGETQHDGDVILGTGGATPNKVDLYVNGDIYQYGSSYETHAEQIFTTKDHIILRDGAVSGLITGEHSGIQVMNYDGNDTQFHLCIGRDGYGRVGDTDANGDPVAEVYSYEFSDYHLYKDTDSSSATYGHYFDDKKLEIEHNFYIPTGATNVTYTETAELDEDDEPTGLYTVTMEYDLTGDSLQKLLTIEETPQDQSLLYWDAEAKCSRTLIKPATVDDDHALVPVYNGSHIEYRKYMSAEETGNGSVFVGTQAQFEAALLIPEGDEGYLPDNCIVVINDKNDYLHTDDIIVGP